MTRITFFAPLFLLPLAASCVDTSTPTIDLGTQTPEGPTADDTSEEVDLASLGLELTVNSDTHVAGTFTKDEATVGFDFEKIGDDLHILVTTANGAPLIEADVLRGGGHNTSMLGGRLLIDGDGEKMPSYEGDRKVESELHEMAEGVAIHSLEPALQAAHINYDLIPTLHARGTSSAATPYVGYGNCGAYITDGGYATCGSWFLGWTSLVVQNCTPYWSSYVITSGMDGQAAAPAGGWQNMGPGSPPWYCSRNDHSGWWWGWNITYKWGSHYYWAGWSATHVWGQANYFGH